MSCTGPIAIMAPLPDPQAGRGKRFLESRRPARSLRWLLSHHSSLYRWSLHHPKKMKDCRQPCRRPFRSRRSWGPGLFGWDTLPQRGVLAAHLGGGNEHTLAQIIEIPRPLLAPSTRNGEQHDLGPRVICWRPRHVRNHGDGGPMPQLSSSSNAASTSYPSAAAISGAAQTTRPSPATGTITSNTSAISSSDAPAASARPTPHSTQAPGEPMATDAPTRSSAAVLWSRADAATGSSPSLASSSTRPSSNIASLRRVSWNLAIWPMRLRSPPCYQSTSCRGELHPPDGMKYPSSSFQETPLADWATAWLREEPPSFGQTDFAYDLTVWGIGTSLQRSPGTTGRWTAAAEGAARRRRCWGA